MSFQFVTLLLKPARCVLATLLLAAPTPLLRAAEVQYRMDSWKTEDGMPHNIIPALVVTRDGYLWLGTQAGLGRFDGVRVTLFDRANTDNLKSDHIECLVESRAGGLWIGTFGGAGNGDYRGELQQALHAIKVVMTAQNIPWSEVLIRLDGLYGNAVVLAEVLQQRVGIIGRWKDYALLDLPMVQARLPASRRSTGASSGNG